MTVPGQLMKAFSVSLSAAVPYTFPQRLLQDSEYKILFLIFIVSILLSTDVFSQGSQVEARKFLKRKKIRPASRPAPGREGGGRPRAQPRRLREHPGGGSARGRPGRGRSRGGGRGTGRGYLQRGGPDPAPHGAVRGPAAGVGGGLQPGPGPSRPRRGPGPTPERAGRGAGARSVRGGGGPSA